MPKLSLYDVLCEEPEQPDIYCENCLYNGEDATQCENDLVSLQGQGSDAQTYLDMAQEQLEEEMARAFQQAGAGNLQISSCILISTLVFSLF